MSTINLKRVVPVETDEIIPRAVLREHVELENEINPVCLSFRVHLTTTQAQTKLHTRATLLSVVALVIDYK